MNNLSTYHDEARPEMDDMLRDFFRAEMPHPWPTFTTPKPLRLKRPATLWSRYAGRLALAACVGLLVAGYLGLSGYFVTPDAGTGLQQGAPMIGHKEKGSKVNIETPPDVPTPMLLDTK
jgi:hypothetical protein